jgi:hypothetical protein
MTRFLTLPFGMNAGFLGLWTFCGVSHPKENRTKSSPNVGMSPMLTEDVRGILRACNLEQVNNPGSNSLTYAMVGQGLMPLL